MAASRKYEGLPDIDDTAQDVFETPDLIDDISTVQDTSALGTDEDEEDDGPIDRGHLKADSARSRFRSAKVDAKNVDFSGRFNLVHRSYKTYSRGHDGEDFNSSDDEETIDEKLARLRREVELLEASVQEESRNDDQRKNGNVLQHIENLGEALDNIYSKRQGVSNFTIAKNGSPSNLKEHSSVPLKINKSSNSPTDIDTTMMILQQATAFESRLSFLEQSLGLGESNVPENSDPIIPSLNSIETSLKLITGQPTIMENSNLKVKQLLKEIDKLHQTTDETLPINSDQLSKINALYSLLPTIDKISPTLPLVLERLRCLHLVHANATNASEILDEIEKRHEEQIKDIDTWKKALEAVEKNLDGNENTLRENMDKMGTWIQDLESRLRNT